MTQIRDRSDVLKKKKVFGKEKKYPATFNVFITEKCNLDCSYCFVDKTSHSHVYGFDDFKKAVNRFFAYPGNKKTIGFLGGEPLLKFSMLKKFYQYAAQKAKEGDIELSVSLVTNGTLLTREKHKFIEDVSKQKNATVKISIDGIKAAHDRNRMFGGGVRRSSFDAIVRNIKNFEEDGSLLAASLVITPETIDVFLENIKFLHKLGFSQIDFYPDMYAYWAAKDLKKLRKIFKEFKEFYCSLRSGGRKEDVFQNSTLSLILYKKKDIGGEKTKAACRKMHLAPDGNFYFCDKVFSLPLSKRKEYVIGNVKRPIDNEKRMALVKKFGTKARSVLGEKCNTCAYREFCSCPIGHYIYFSYKKWPLERRFNNFCLLSKIFWGVFFDIKKELK